VDAVTGKGQASGARRLERRRRRGRIESSDLHFVLRVSMLFSSLFPYLLELLSELSFPLQSCSTMIRVSSRPLLMLEVSELIRSRRVSFLLPPASISSSLPSRLLADVPSLRVSRNLVPFGCSINVQSRYSRRNALFTDRSHQRTHRREGPLSSLRMDVLGRSSSSRRSCLHQ